MPDFSSLRSLFDTQAWIDVGLSMLFLGLAVLLGFILNAILFRVIARLTQRTKVTWDDLIPKYAKKPGYLIFPFLLLNLVIPYVQLPAEARAFLDHLLELFLIGSMGYLGLNLSFMLRDFLLSRYDIMSPNNLEARKMHTQLGVLLKILIVIDVVFTLAFMLMTFEGVRQVGTSILASAGIAGIVLGLAAQKSIGNLLAGIQIAITQPIRVDDVVIVEGEWGRIEDIALTYVVVRIWDQRRLMLPITYFIEKPFQNWTRTSSDILGTVFLYTDYTLPVDAVRQELQRLAEASPLWDKRVCVTQVTECKPNVMEVRLLVSAADASLAWELRCHLREKMIGFIQREYPQCLPRFRAELEQKADAKGETLPELG